MDPIISQPEPRPDASGQKPQYQAPMPEIPAPQMEPLRKIFTPKFVALIIAIVLIGAGAYGAIWWWGNQNSNPPIGGAIPSATPDPTADWKTYTNTQYGFEFKYPSSFSLKSLADNCNDPNVPPLECHGFEIFLSKDGLSSISLGVDEPGNALISMEGNVDDNAESVITNTNGIKIYKHPYYYKGSISKFRYAINKSGLDYWEIGRSNPEYDFDIYNGTYYSFWNLSPNEQPQGDPNFLLYQKITEQILSTFKFIP